MKLLLYASTSISRQGGYNNNKINIFDFVILSMPSEIQIFMVICALVRRCFLAEF